jgi:hypothetical protein
MKSARSRRTSNSLQERQKMVELLDGAVCAACVLEPRME